MTTASSSRARASKAARRAGGMTAPVGDWCDGVTQMIVDAIRDAGRAGGPRHRRQAAAGSAPAAIEGGAQRRIAGIFDRHARNVPGSDKQARQHVEGFLRAGGDDQVVRPADDGAYKAATWPAMASRSAGKPCARP
jgi:hypothetical protein